MPAPLFTPDPGQPLRLLSACPVYAPTPLRTLPLSDGLEISAKDETARMGLGAFKALGGVYAVARLIGAAWQAAGGGVLEPADYLAPEVAASAARITFVTASAGNHGMAVAAGARLFGAKARIYLAETVPEAFAARLREKGAEVVRHGADYEASIAGAIADAARSGAVHLADGSWPGYTAAPALVMEGYTVIAEELRADFATHGGWPTHVFLQAGVGGLAAAMATMIRRNWEGAPDIVVVEPDAAPCLAASHAAGALTPVAGPVSTMGRLDCKEASMLAFDALEAAGVRYLAISDEAAAEAAEELRLAGLATTPSGAAGLAGLRAHLATGHSPARPLIIVSEGAVSVSETR